MTSLNLMKPEQLEPSKFAFSKAILNESTLNKVVFVNKTKDDTSKIFVKTDYITLSSGIKRIRKKTAKDNKEDSFVVDIPLKPDDVLFKKNQEFDNVILAQMKKNSEEWLSKKEVSHEVLVDRHKKIISEYRPRDESGNEGDKVFYSFQLKLDREMDGNGNPTGRFVSNKQRKEPVLFFKKDPKVPGPPTLIEINESNYDTQVPKGSKVRMVYELVYVSIAAGKVGVKWKLIQMEITPNTNYINSYAFDDEPSESVEPEPQQVEELVQDLSEELEEVVEEDLEEEDLEVVEEVVEEDEYEEVSVEPEPEPLPEPPKKVKKVKK
jgi:hypothetical protein